MTDVVRIRHKKGRFWVVDQKPPYESFATYEEAMASLNGVVEPEVVVEFEVVVEPEAGVEPWDEL